MKKIKFIAPMLSITTLGSVVAPIVTSCGCSQQSSYIVPTDELNIVGHTLKGFGSKTDFNKFVDYTTMVIPDSVKFIDDGAFKDVMTIGKKSGFIDTVVVPNTVKEIRESAFEGCDSIRVLDFSTWTATEIYQLQVSTDAFKSLSNVGKVIVNENISKESKDKLQKLLVGGGLNPMWFAEESTDKVTADSAWLSQKVEEGSAATYLFKLNVDLKAGAELHAQVIRTGGTKGVNVKCNSAAILTVRDGIVEVPAQLVDASKTDEYAEFSITITAMRNVGSEFDVYWSQTVTGFKLINIHVDTPEPEPTDLYDLTQPYTPTETAQASTNETADSLLAKYFPAVIAKPEIYSNDYRWHFSKWIVDEIASGEITKNSYDKPVLKAKATFVSFENNILTFKLKGNFDCVMNGVESNEFTCVYKDFTFDITIKTNVSAQAEFFSDYNDYDNPQLDIEFENDPMQKFTGTFNGTFIMDDPYVFNNETFDIEAGQQPSEKAQAALNSVSLFASSICSYYLRPCKFVAPLTCNNARTAEITVAQGATKFTQTFDFTISNDYDIPANHELMLDIYSKHETDTNSGYYWEGGSELVVTGKQAKAKDVDISKHDVDTHHETVIYQGDKANFYLVISCNEPSESNAKGRTIWKQIISDDFNYTLKRSE